MARSGRRKPRRRQEDAGAPRQASRISEGRSVPLAVPHHLSRTPFPNRLFEQPMLAAGSGQTHLAKDGLADAVRGNNAGEPFHMTRLGMFALRLFVLERHHRSEEHTSALQSPY